MGSVALISTVLCCRGDGVSWASGPLVGDRASLAVFVAQLVWAVSPRGSFCLPLLGGAGRDVVA